MAAPYDYVQIVDDDNWGLVGIVPNNLSSNPFIKHNLISSESPNITHFPKATIINKRRPITLPKTPNGFDMMTPAELVTTSTSNILTEPKTSDILLFGEISNLAAAVNRDSILVGFGR